MITNYELGSGQLNREINDVLVGASLYDSPMRYIELSPDMHFGGLSTANLFEGGAQAEAIYMLGYSKASRRFGLPTEMIIYPKTTHGISAPRLQKESAERNLDWFRYWLKGEEDTNSSKVEQYRRWRNMRTPMDQNTKAVPVSAVRAQ